MCEARTIERLTDIAIRTRAPARQGDVLLPDFHCTAGPHHRTRAVRIVAQAMVYIGVVGLLLDQGFSSALIQRRRLEKDLPGAVVTVNLIDRSRAVAGHIGRRAAMG